MDAHRGFGAIEHARDFLRGEIFFDLKHQRRALLRRQTPQGLPRLRHQLLPRDASRGIVLGWSRLPLENVVARGTRLGREPAPLPALPPPTMVETEVDENAVEPRRELRATIEARGALEEPQECFLREVLRVVGVT